MNSPSLLRRQIPLLLLTYVLPLPGDGESSSEMGPFWQSGKRFVSAKGSLFEGAGKAARL